MHMYVCMTACIDMDRYICMSVYIYTLLYMYLHVHVDVRER